MADVAILGDGPVTFAQAGRMLSNADPAGRTYAPSTVWRWATRGVLAPDGQRVFLAHRRLGRRAFTTGADLAAFAARLGKTVRMHADPQQATACHKQDPRKQLRRDGFYTDRVRSRRSTDPHD